MAGNRPKHQTLWADDVGWGEGASAASVGKKFRWGGVSLGWGGRRKERCRGHACGNEKLCTTCPNISADATGRLTESTCIPPLREVDRHM